MFKKFSTEVKWGVIFAIAGLIWMLIEKVFGLHGENIDKHPLYTWGFFIPALIIYYLGIKEKRDKDYGGKITWVQGFAAGMVMALVVAIISPFSQYIFHTFISPDYFQNAIDMGVEMGRGTAEEIGQMMNLKAYMIMAPLSTIGMGAITSAVMALILKR